MESNGHPLSAARAGCSCALSADLTEKRLLLSATPNLLLTSKGLEQGPGALRGCARVRTFLSPPEVYPLRERQRAFGWDEYLFHFTYFIFLRHDPYFVFRF